MIQHPTITRETQQKDFDFSKTLSLFFKAYKFTAPALNLSLSLNAEVKPCQ